jgi:hypothetical protein
MCWHVLSSLCDTMHAICDVSAFVAFTYQAGIGCLHDGNVRKAANLGYLLRRTALPWQQA